MTQDRWVDNISSALAGFVVACLTNLAVHSWTGYYMSWDHFFMIGLIVAYGSYK